MRGKGTHRVLGCNRLSAWWEGLLRKGRVLEEGQWGSLLAGVEQFVHCPHVLVVVVVVVVLVVPPVLCNLCWWGGRWRWLIGPRLLLDLWIVVGRAYLVTNWVPLIDWGPTVGGVHISRCGRWGWWGRC